jgi:hypothetical protein
MESNASIGTYNDIVASSEVVDDAKAVECRGGNPDKWAQQGTSAFVFVSSTD